MTNQFGVQKISVFGTSGEFSVGGSASEVSAKYLMTKIRPGADGTWDTQLASHMLPWREVFSLESLSFEELLQRDLDDSRVAHELIPYLLGEQGMSARFFPPILAVLVPKSPSKNGIDDYYPAEDKAGSFGDLFEIEKVQIDGQDSPLERLSYNPQKCTFIIADGQHRAMAVLALHRQLTKSWENSTYSTFYSHLKITPEQVKHIELPVCLLYFPEVTEKNNKLKEKDIQLSKLCRELFIIVNRSAKAITQSRELLLDDDDFAARLMRSTLSSLKDRSEDSDSKAKIFSFAFGDSDSDRGSNVATGKFEYCTAVALYKLHSIICFGRIDAFGFNSNVDVSNMINTRNPERPIDLLEGSGATARNRLSKGKVGLLTVKELEPIVSCLEELSSSIVLALFDEFSPFVIHNETVAWLRVQLSDEHVKSDPIQNKCFNLIFEGSGVRNIFEEHADRMKDKRDDYGENDEDTPDHIERQIRFCDSVSKSMNNHEQAFQRMRASSLFNVRYESIYSSDSSHDDKVELESKAKQIYVAISTQAFQIGYVMAVSNIIKAIESQYDSDSPIDFGTRRQITNAVVSGVIVGLNQFFEDKGKTQHKKLVGLITEQRIHIFDTSAPGLRQMYSLSNSQIDEKHWGFFRYSILEIMHSKISWEAVKVELMKTDDVWNKYVMALPTIVDAIHSYRNRYIEAAKEKALKNQEFLSDIAELKGRSKEAGLNEELLDKKLQELEDKKKDEISILIESHIKASLKVCESPEKMALRLS